MRLTLYRPGIVLRRLFRDPPGSTSAVSDCQLDLCTRTGDVADLKRGCGDSVLIAGDHSVDRHGSIEHFRDRRVDVADCGYHCCRQRLCQ